MYIVSTSQTHRTADGVRDVVGAASRIALVDVVSRVQVVVDLPTLGHAGNLTVGCEVGEGQLRAAEEGDADALDVLVGAGLSQKSKSKSKSK